MKKSIVFGVLLISAAVCGQQELRNRFGEVYYAANLYTTNYNAFEGTPYLNEEFTPAKINDVSETKLVRFDAFEDRVEIRVSANKVVILQASEPYVISLLDGSDRIFETKKSLDEKGNTTITFFELIANHKDYKLYLKEKIKFSKAEKAQGYDKAKPATFKKQHAAYYITDFKTPSGQLIRIPSKVKSFVAFLPKSSKPIKKFIKDNKIKKDKGDDLVKIFDFYFENN